MTIIDDLSQAARDAATAIEPSVVSIGRAGRGTGLVIGEGLVLTNAHNLRDRTTLVSFADGRAAQGTVVGADLDGDLAVLAVDTGGTAPVSWAETAPERGDLVFAVGRGGHRFRLSLGVVSATEQAFRGPRGRRIDGSLEHTAPLARGSSGGAVLDRHGAVVAVNTSRLGEGFYLAIPADADLRARIDRLARGEAPQRRSLGVALAPPRVTRRLRASVGLSERDGLLVRAVDPGSPAAAAGIAQGDLIVGAAGSPVASVDDLHRALDAVGDGTGDGLELRVVRGEEERVVAVSFSTPDDAEPAGDA